MSSYKELVPFVLHWEGGYVNDPDDPGGATNKGVTFATWKRYCTKKGIPATLDGLKNITDEQWGEIFKTMYWDRAKADRIESQPIANLLVDFLYHSGRHAITHLQRLVGVKDDGIMGPKTLAAINSQGAITLFWKYHADRLAFLDHQIEVNPRKAKYRNGWHNRVNAITYEGLQY